MKEIKIQQDILKIAQTSNKVAFGELKDGRMGVTLDAYAVYIIYSNNLFIDTTKFKTFNLQYIFDCVSEAKDIFPTGIHIYRGKDTVIEFKNDKTTAYFNKKLFNYFDTKTKMSYKYHQNKLFVFEDGVLVGMVLETKLNR